MDVPTEGFKNFGSPPGQAGLYTSFEGGLNATQPTYYGVSGSQGLAFINLNENNNIDNISYGAAQTFECVAGTDNSTFYTVYRRGNIYPNGTITADAEISCELSKISEERLVYQSGTACPANLTDASPFDVRIPNSVQPEPLSTPCNSSSNLLEPSKFVSNTAPTPIDVDALFPPFANKGSPPGFAGVYYQFDMGSDYFAVHIHDVDSLAVTTFNRVDDFPEAFAAVVGEYVSYECIDKYQYRSTYSIRYYFGNGTVKAVARCRVAAYDPVAKVKTLVLSDTDCPKDKSDTEGTLIKTLRVNRLFGQGEEPECFPLPTSPSPAPQPSPPSSSSGLMTGFESWALASFLLVIFGV